MSQVSDLIKTIKPFVLQWLSQAGGGAGPYAPSPHDLQSAHHTGSIADTQATQFLLTSGARQLTGNQSVAAGVTIDGVDVSAFAAVDFVTLSLSGEVPNERALVAGAGLTLSDTGAGGSATLAIATADTSITVNADSIAVNLATTSGLQVSSGLQIADAIAGAGLTITSKVLAVGAGTLISVAADAVGLSNGSAQYQIPVTGATPFTPSYAALSTFAGGGLVFSSGVFAVGAGAGITVNADDVALTTPGTLTVSTTNSATGSHTHAVTSSENPGAATSLLRSSASGYLQLVRLGLNVAPTVPLHVASATEQMRLEYNTSNYSAFTVDSTGTLSITPTNNLMLNPAGDVVFDPTGNDLLPATGYDLNIGALNKKYLTLHAAELWVETLVAQSTLATIGGRILVGPTTTLTADISAGATSIVVKHNNLANGDRVYLEANGLVEFMAITSAPSGSGPYTYTVTRDLDGSGANAWSAGDAVFNTGQTGNGFIDLYSVRGVKTASQAGPTIVGNVRNSATFNDWSEHWAIGNLNGLYGYGVDTYGVGVGRYSTTTSYLLADATNGIRIMRGTVQLAQWDISGNILIGQAAVGQSNLYVTSGKVSFRNNVTELVRLGDLNGALDYSSATYGFAFGNLATPITSASRFLAYDPTNGLRLRGNVTIGDGLGSSYGVNVGEALMVCHFDGPRPYETDLTGSVTGHRGQVPTQSGTITFEPGKFGKGVVVAESVANGCSNPSVETDLTGWAEQYDGGAVLTLSRSNSFAKFGSYSAQLEATAGSTYLYNQPHFHAPASSFNWYDTENDKPTLSCYIKIASGTWRVVFEDAGQNLRSYQEFTTTGGGWQRVSITLENTIGADYASVKLSFYPMTAGTMYVDGVLYDDTYYLRPYTDTSRTAARLYYTETPPVNWSFMFWAYRVPAQAKNWGYLLNRGDDYTAVFYNSINQDSICSVNAGAPSDGWHHYLATYDGTTVKAYRDGALVGSHTNALAAGNDWDLGSQGGLYKGNTALDEFCILDRALTADEVRAIYESNGPVVVETGSSELRLTGALTGYVAGNSRGLFGYSDASGAANTGVFALVTTASTVLGAEFGSPTLDAGDFMLGQVGSGRMNMLWDASAGKLQFRGNTTVQVEIGTDGKLYAGAGAFVIDVAGLSITQGQGSANAIKWFLGATKVSSLYSYTGPSNVASILSSGVAGYSGTTILEAVNSDGTTTTRLALTPGSGIQVYGQNGGIGGINVGDNVFTALDGEMKAYFLSTSGLNAINVSPLYVVAASGQSASVARVVDNGGSDLFAVEPGGASVGKFRLVATSAGAPTGGTNGDMVVDTTNNRFYIRVGGTWRYAALT